MRIKYIAKFNGHVVGQRASARLDKIYTHAVVITYDDGRHPKVVTWCSRIDLARDQQRQWSHRYSAHIVPAEITNLEQLEAYYAARDAASPNS